MKEEQAIYTCDNCKNCITVPLNNYAGTPLHCRWIRMYILLRPTDTIKTKVHFCSKTCAAHFLLDGE